MKIKQNTDAVAQKCIDLGLVSTGDKHLDQDNIQDYYLQRDPRKNNFGFKFVLNMKSPALCKQINQVPDKIRNAFIDGTCDLNKYLVEQKYDGVRMIVTYSKTEGFDFYTRSVSETTFLPISYKANIDTLCIDPKLTNFVIDCELTANYAIKDEALLHTVSGLLSNLPEEAIQKQKDHPRLLSFNIFDCLYLNNDNVWEKNLDERRAVATLIALTISNPLFKMPQAITEMQPRDAFQALIEKGAEGIVIKDRTLPYDMTGSRTKSGWVKWKKAIDPIDCFISGYEDSEADSRSDLIGALQFSVYDEDGNEHHIATCSNFPMSIRTDATVIQKGKPILAKKYYGKVASITGLAFSTINKRMVHCIITDWRPDRSKDTCIIEKKILDEGRM